MWLEKSRRFLARLLAVELTPAQSRYAQFLDQRVPERGSWLDLGCGHQFIPEWCHEANLQPSWTKRVEHLVGIDRDPSLSKHPYLTHRVYGLGDQLPFASGSFDLVSANMVLEHLEDPLQVFAEVQRVLKPGGIFLFHTPNARNYLISIARRVPECLKKPIIWILERRKVEDVFPTFYRANTVTELEAFAQRLDFQQEDLRVVASSGTFWRIWGLNFLEIIIMRALRHPALQDREAVLMGVFRKRL